VRERIRDAGAAGTIENFANTTKDKFANLAGMLGPSLFDPESYNAANKDFLGVSTAQARRNLNLTSGGVVFVLVARGFRLPDRIPAFGLELNHSGGLVAGVIALLAYHTLRYWTCRAADEITYDSTRNAVLDRMSLVSVPLNVLDQLPLSRYTPEEIRGSVKLFSQSIHYQLDRIELLTRPGRWRAKLDFRVPLWGAALAVTVLTGSLAYERLRPVAYAAGPYA
jgi:hypothetical protein